MQKAIWVYPILCALALSMLALPAVVAADDGAAEPVDLNAATEDELIEVPGIGPATAQRILDWREEHGPFESVEDLMKIKGIGEKSFEKLRRYVAVSKSKSGSR